MFGQPKPFFSGYSPVSATMQRQPLRQLNYHFPYEGSRSVPTPYAVEHHHRNTESSDYHRYLNRTFKKRVGRRSLPPTASLSHGNDSDSDYEYTRQQVADENVFVWLLNYCKCELMTPEQTQHLSVCIATLNNNMFFRICCTIGRFSLTWLLCLLKLALSGLQTVCSWIVDLLPQRATLCQRSLSLLWDMSHATLTDFSRYKLILCKMPLLCLLSVLGLIVEFYHECKQCISGAARRHV